MARPKKLSPEAIEVLASMTITGNQAVITAGQLSRPLYLEVNEALEVLGGKWNKKAKSHVFDGDPADAIEQVTLDGEFTNEKREFEFFETPAEVAAKLVDLIDLKPGDQVLEPSCGDGSLIGAVLSKQPKAEVYAFEIRGDAAAKAHKKFYAPNVVINILDFMTRKPKKSFKFVVMNPPFSRQQDLDHILHAHKFLKPGGTLVSVAAAGTIFRQNQKAVEFRKFVAAQGGVIRELPKESFKGSGTNVNTCIVEIPA